MNRDAAKQTERMIGKVLRAGIALSAMIIFAGLVMYLATGSSGYPAGYFPYAPGDILQGLFLLKPFAIILLGLFVLILTPILRVGISILLFWREGDALYVKITSLVFSILIISMLLGKAGL